MVFFGGSGLRVCKGGAGGRGCSEDGLLGGLCETVYVFLDHSVGWFWQAEVQMVCGRWCVLCGHWGSIVSIAC